MSQFQPEHALAADELLPVVYRQLRQLAGQMIANEPPGHTLQATALVHEVYFRMHQGQARWTDEAHFYRAAAEAMRRILVDHVRRKRRLKRGGNRVRQQGAADLAIAVDYHEDLIALDDALDKLTLVDVKAAELVKLRYFAGMPLAQVSKTLGVPKRSVDRLWAFAKAWLHREISTMSSEDGI
jgi:RNA polymerase sigma factor (TIGR02999 family)